MAGRARLGGPERVAAIAELARDLDVAALGQDRLHLGGTGDAQCALDALAQPTAIVLRLASIGGGAWLAFTSPIWLVRSLLASTLLALPYAFVYLRSERSTDVLFGILYGWFALFALFWVQPFATITVRRNGWLTRG